jgi:hypothetical protein
MLKGINNSYTNNNTSHITQMLKDKIERLESRGEKKSSFTGSRGTAELKLMRGPTCRQNSQSKRESQELLPVADRKTQWKEKGKEELHNFCQNNKRDRGERYFERYYRNGLSSWFYKIYK